MNKQWDNAFTREMQRRVDKYIKEVDLDEKDIEINLRGWWWKKYFKKYQLKKWLIDRELNKYYVEDMTTPEWYAKGQQERIESLQEHVNKLT